jgi:hypothetical protein
LKFLKNFKDKYGWTLWCMPVIPALKKLRQEDPECMPVLQNETGSDNKQKEWVEGETIQEMILGR